MGDLEAGILALVDELVLRNAPSPAPSFVPSPAVPAGLTLHNTYTTSTGSLTWPVDWVYVVAVGGGGSGSSDGTASNVAGGGGGACVQGWVRAADLTSVTIGAGGAGVIGALGNNGGDTIAGPIRAPGGGCPMSTFGVLKPKKGAGWGGYVGSTTLNMTEDIALSTERTLFGMFAGGGPGISSVRGDDATSGGGAGGNAAGGSGFGGPGGGGSGGGAAGVGIGGSSLSPNGTTYTGGTSPLNGGGGGGAGILANGANAVTTTGGAGGSGGGGGGGTFNAAVAGGAGGNGAVLVYY